jgi:hypothetical protein
LEIVVDSKNTVRSSIEEAFDTDWVRVELLAGERYIIDLLGTDTNDGTLINPTIVGIFDDTAAFIGNSNDNDSGTGNNAQVTFDAERSGTHYIAVGAGFDGIGTYTLTTSVADRLARSSHTDTAAKTSTRSSHSDLPETTDTTATLTAGGSATGTIDSNGDRDWFRTTLTAGNQYTIDPEGSTTSAGTLIDPLSARHL